MKNLRITPKDRNAIKGALRRAFSRSALRQSVLIDAIVEHGDPERPRVKVWCKCAACGKPEAKSYMIVDHILPVIPLDTTMEEMSLDDVVNNLWCDRNNLQVLDQLCHDVKTKEEKQLRKQYKKGKIK